MEPHPIPQNVTSFQFHLIGDMTLKQFGYLASGSTIAYLLFVFLAPIYPLVAWPLILISALSGVAFAFLPINSRPLDHWVGAFFKAIYSPTKRVWKKNGKTFVQDPLFNSRLVTYLSNAAARPSTPPVMPIPTPANPQTTVRPTQPPPANNQMPTPDDLKKTVELARQAQNLQMRIIQTERALSQIKEQAQNPNPAAIDYTQQVNKVLADLQGLVGQASQIKQQLESVGISPNQPLPPPTPAVKAEVKVVTPTKTKATQIALTTFPNVINGIIKDTKGNYLDAVVVVIYDKEGLPVRALKTNKLGQFTGSTPLPNATYRIEMEKEGFSFDVLQIELTGQVLSPLTITTKNVQPAQT